MRGLAGSETSGKRALRLDGLEVRGKWLGESQIQQVVPQDARLPVTFCVICRCYDTVGWTVRDGVVYCRACSSTSRKPMECTHCHALCAKLGAVAGQLVCDGCATYYRAHKELRPRAGPDERSVSFSNCVLCH